LNKKGPNQISKYTAFVKGKKKQAGPHNELVLYPLIVTRLVKNKGKVENNSIKKKRVAPESFFVID
jgi:hypothetical protein